MGATSDPLDWAQTTLQLSASALESFSLPLTFFWQLTQKFVGLFLYDDAVLWKMRQYVNVVSELKALRPVVITTRNTPG